MEQETIITFEDIRAEFVKRSEYREIIRPPKARHTQRFIDGCRFWNGRYWEECDSEKLYGILSAIIVDLGEVKQNRKDAYIKNFISHFSIRSEEYERSSDSLFVIKNGVIDLNALLKCWKKTKSLEGLWEIRKDWFFDFKTFKYNYLTHAANVRLPEKLNLAKYSEDMGFFKSILLRTFGNQEESVDQFLKFLALSHTGDNTGNVFCNPYGKEKTGKSTIHRFLNNFYGNYHQTITTDCLFKENFNNLEQLFNCRNAKLVSVCEPNNERKDVSLLKKATGHDTLVFDKTIFEFKPSIIIFSNHLIIPKEKDSGGFDRRYALLPCGPVVQTPDSALLDKMIARKESFLIELLKRYVIFMSERESSNKMLEKPEITKKTVETIAKFQNPVKWFFDTWCTAFPSGIPFIGGTDMRLTDIRAIFMQSFIEFYNAEFRKLYFSSEDFYVHLTSISPQEFDAKMKSFHFNYDIKHQGRAIVFHNFIVQNPGKNQTVREFYQNQLVKFRYASDIDSAKELIHQAAMAPTILRTEDLLEENYTDLANDLQYPGFGYFNIPASKHIWIEVMLKNINFGLLSGNSFQFSQWLYSTVKEEKGIEIFNKMK